MADVLKADRTSMTGAARRVQESVDLFGQYTDALMNTIAGSGRSAWGIGVIGMAMDQINETVGGACRHLHDNLDKAGTSLRVMTDRTDAAEQASTATIQALDAGRS
ncbi:hypothetical protein ABZ297_08895 [Nonomuraea sp. NPDC005983]|uniref:hypothetical protein n=1 Tax=Nonomuraea sp. NPDC005983 TaxID=3155595 RepID=UPI0033A1A5D3